MAGPINVVVDLSHHNASVDFKKLRAGGVVGVIHKATQGTGFADKKYKSRRQAALDEGLLWGAYHFGVGGDGSDQADFFLETVGSDPQTLLVLDFEPDLTGPTMTLSQARDFVEHTSNVTGRFPGLYSGHLIKELLGSAPVDPVLSHCFLWFAQYKGPKPLGIPPTFRTWTFWQYTDGVHGPEPHEASGVGPCDRNFFNGSIEQLNELWGTA